MKTITIYTTPVCPFSRQLREFLMERHIAFTEHNVIDQPERLSEMQALTRGSSTVPVIVFNKTLPDQAVSIGFEPTSLEKSLYTDFTLSTSTSTTSSVA